MALTVLIAVPGLGGGTAFAQSAEALITSGKSALAKGDYKDAIRQFTRAMRVDDLTTEQLASAFYQRGLAYRKSGQNAESIADITRALWFNKLAAPDRKAALQSRGLSYQSLGFGKKAKADFAASGQGAPVKAADTAPPEETKTAAAAEKKVAAAKQPENSSSSGSGFFSNLFGVGAAAPKPKPKKAETDWSNVTETKVASATPQPVSDAAPVKTSPASSWEATTTRQPAARVASVSTTNTAAVVDDGHRYTVQIAAVRSVDDATALWRRMKDRHGAVLANRTPLIQRADLGEKGIFYRVQISPVASRPETQALCDQLKAKGTYCILVRR